MSALALTMSEVAENKGRGCFFPPPSLDSRPVWKSEPPPGLEAQDVYRDGVIGPARSPGYRGFVDRCFGCLPSDPPLPGNRATVQPLAAIGLLTATLPQGARKGFSLAPQFATLKPR
jgi:hypothetical protein